MSKAEVVALTNQKMDEDKVGLGQHYCVTCARYFITEKAIETHRTTKEHKKRFKICTTEVPYTLEEAEKCGGLFRPELDRIQKNMAANVESYDLK